MPKKPRAIRNEDDTQVQSRQTNYSESLTIPILLKTSNVLIIDKPYDVHIDGKFPITIEKLVNSQHPEMSTSTLTTTHNTEKRKLKFCHQLDFSTSGILCLAFTRKECARISTCFQDRTAHKQYLAVVLGHINNKENNTIIIRTLIGNDIHDERQFKMAVIDPCDQDTIAKSDAKFGETKCTILQHGYYQSTTTRIPVTKVLLEPTSGRRHQLRLHMKHIGHGIVGDVTYTGDVDCHRMMLHAWRLILPVDLNTSCYRRKDLETSSSFEAPDPFVGSMFDWNSTTLQ
jgi:23S rRNA-/tRNA-specific pseudouridylate synthase